MRDQRSITAEAIASGTVAEDQTLDFKREVDLDDPSKKRDFVDDVVGFLNAGAGRLIVGVAEKKGRFDRFRPLSGDLDKIRRRYTSIIQDNVVPKPMRISVDFLEVEGGHLVVIDLPEHRMRPYQNAINGAFHVRTGAQNTPLSRDSVRALFTSIETMEADVARLMEREDRAVADRGILQDDGATLHVAILPIEHYDRSAAPFDPGRVGILKVFPHYHHGDVGIFKGCDDGVEVRDADFNGRCTSRFFIGDDWGVHTVVAHPFTVDPSGRLTLAEFRSALHRHMNAIAIILDDAKVHGPFCMLPAVRHLRRNDRLEWAFPAATRVVMPRPALIERFDEASGVVDRFHDLVRRASVHG